MIVGQCIGTSHQYSNDVRAQPTGLAGWAGSLQRWTVCSIRAGKSVKASVLLLTKVSLRLLESTDLCKVVCLAASWTSTSWEHATSGWLLPPICRLGRLVIVALELQDSLNLGAGAIHSILGDLDCVLSLQSNLYGLNERQFITLILNSTFSTASLLIAHMKHISTASPWGSLIKGKSHFLHPNVSELITPKLSHQACVSSPTRTWSLSDDESLGIKLVPLECCNILYGELINVLGWHLLSSQGTKGFVGGRDLVSGNPVPRCPVGWNWRPQMRGVWPSSLSITPTLSRRVYNEVYWSLALQVW